MAVTESHIAATLRRLAEDATVDGRCEAALAYRTAGQRAERGADRARRISLTAPAVP